MTGERLKNLDHLRNRFSFKHLLAPKCFSNAREIYQTFYYQTITANRKDKIINSISFAPNPP